MDYTPLGSHSLALVMLVEALAPNRRLEGLLAIWKSMWREQIEARVWAAQ